MANQKKSGGKRRLAKGALAAATIAAAAAAGYYFYASKDAKKNRRIAAKWAKGFKADVVKRAQALKNINRDTVAAIVKQSTSAYKGVRNLDRSEVDRAARELKNNWRQVMRELNITKRLQGKTGLRKSKKKSPAKEHSRK